MGHKLEGNRSVVRSRLRDTKKDKSVLYVKFDNVDDFLAELKIDCEYAIEGKIVRLACKHKRETNGRLSLTIVASYFHGPSDRLIKLVSACGSILGEVRDIVGNEIVGKAVTQADVIKKFAADHGLHVRAGEFMFAYSE